MIGETIGNFRVTSRLGAGGMGEVFLAHQLSIETKVAIKVLRPEISVDRAHVDRFFNEARAVSRIKHAGTVKIFDVGFHATGHAYLVMEFLEGETLSARIRRGGLPLVQLAEIVKQTCSVLDATHAAGITHRDLKPDNIFLVPDAELASGERVKILDFGIAKLSDGTAAGRAQTVGTMGTPAYMAPEQWGDAGKVDARADVYSLGCVLFEMATGRPPFLANNIAEACGAHLSQQPPKLRTFAPQLPWELEALIDAMLAKSPEARPPLREVARQLVELPMAPAATAHLPVLAAPHAAPYVAPSAPTMATHHTAPVAQQAPPHATVTPHAHPPSPIPQHTPQFAPVPPTHAISQHPYPPNQLSANTTLSASSGVVPQPVAPRSRAPLYAIGGVLILLIIIAIATRPDPPTAATITDASIIQEARDHHGIVPADAAPSPTNPTTTARTTPRPTTTTRPAAPQPTTTTRPATAPRPTTAQPTTPRPTIAQPQPSTSPRGGRCSDGGAVASIESQGDAAKRDGDFEKALRLYEQIAGCKPGLTQKAYTMACKSHDFIKAKQLFAKLGSLQSALIGHCKNEGFDPRDQSQQAE